MTTTVVGGPVEVGSDGIAVNVACGNSHGGNRSLSNNHGDWWVCAGCNTGVHRSEVRQAQARAANGVTEDAGSRSGGVVAVAR